MRGRHVRPCHLTSSDISCMLSYLSVVKSILPIASSHAKHPAPTKMPPSDLCSAIDDSFDITPVHHPRGEAREGDFYNGPRSGHWTVSEGTVLGSGIDDGFETSFNVAVTPGGGVHAAEQPIPGRVLCRLAKANASERKRDHDRRALHVVEEEIEDPAHACAEGGPKQKAKGARFIVPRIDSKLINLTDVTS